MKRIPSKDVMVVWKTVGFTMVLLLVGMQAIPIELYEAARIDGATWWPIQFFITLPLLRQTIALALIISVVGSTPVLGIHDAQLF